MSSINADGICRLGYYYQYGIETDIDAKKALNYIKWLQIQEKVQPNIYSLTFMYENEEGTMKDMEQAIYCMINLPNKEIKMLKIGKKN